MLAPPWDTDTDWFEEGVDLVTVIQLRYVHVLHVYLYMYI